MAEVIEKFREHYEEILNQKTQVDLVAAEFSEIQRFSKQLELRKNDKKFATKDGRNYEFLNRYRDILPFDSTRVKLKDTPYINASWICKKEYIASQGPKPTTIRVFWEMVLQYKIEVIVMLCKLKEKNCRTGEMKEKCAEYWPLEVSSSKNIEGDGKLENICVTLKSEDRIKGFIMRRLDIKNRSGIHSIIQFQMTNWPDYGVPQNRDEVLSLIDEIRSKRSSKAPILMHCSAGVGRTGTIIAVDRVRQMLQAKNFPKSFTIMQMVKELREQRMKMVQSEEQYRFLYEMIDYMFFGPRKSPPDRGDSLASRTSSISGPKSEISRKSEKSRQIQSPARFNTGRRSAKETRPKSEYSDKRHTRANLRKSNSVDKINSPVLHQADHPAVSSKSRLAIKEYHRSRPARSNGIKGRSRSNSRENKIDSRKISQSSSDIEFSDIIGPGMSGMVEPSSDSWHKTKKPKKPSKEIVKLKENGKSKSSLFS